MNEWISVKDRLPLYKECILVLLDDTYIADAVYRGEYEKKVHIFRIELTREDIELSIKDKYGRITHWMPLPDSPKEDNKL